MLKLSDTPPDVTSAFHSVYKLLLILDDFTDLHFLMLIAFLQCILPYCIVNKSCFVISCFSRLERIDWGQSKVWEGRVLQGK